MKNKVLVVTFRDGTTAYGKTATLLLQSLTGGWNPTTVSELRIAFLRRAGWKQEEINNSAIGDDLEFLRFCSSSRKPLWVLQENVEQPFPLFRSNGVSWAVTARSSKLPAIAR